MTAFSSPPESDPVASAALVTAVESLNAAIASSTQVAATVAVTPAGSLTQTDVQAALSALATRSDLVERGSEDLGNLGAIHTLTMVSKEAWLRGTLNTDLTLTLAALSPRSLAILILTQDATGGRALSISDGSNTQSVDIVTAAGETSIVYAYSPDGVDVYLNVASGTAGPTGAAGATGATGPAGPDMPYGPLVNRPSAATAGDKGLYFATDTDGGTLYQVHAAAWVALTRGATAAPASHANSHSPGGIDALPLRTGVFGDGLHGAAVLDGVNTFAWCALAGSTYTLNRNAYLTNLTINAGITLDIGNYLLHGTGTLSGAGTIKGAGKAGAASTTVAGGAGGAATAAGYLVATPAGGAGATAAGAAASAGAAQVATVAMGGQGGVGGAGAASAGAAATVMAFGVNTGYPVKSLHQLLNGSFVAAGVARTFSGGGAGGGGGAAATSQGGGGGGEPGRYVLVAFSVINFGGTVDASGGAGGNANTAAGGGGGGGGGGGYVALITQRLQTTPTINVAGGAGGTGSNANGAAGTAGTTTILEIA